jgi:hypothetical protein
VTRCVGRCRGMRRLVGGDQQERRQSVAGVRRQEISSAQRSEECRLGIQVQQQQQLTPRRRGVPACAFADWGRAGLGAVRPVLVGIKANSA